MDILKEIIAMDKAAAERVEARKQELNERLSESSGAAAKALEETLKKEREKLEAFRAEQERLLADKQSGADAARAESEKRLDDAFEAHRAQWREEIMNRITQA